jgi:hypothetical protein
VAGGILLTEITLHFDDLADEEFLSSATHEMLAKQISGDSKCRTKVERAVKGISESVGIARHGTTI